MTNVLVISLFFVLPTIAHAGSVGFANAAFWKKAGVYFYKYEKAKPFVPLIGTSPQANLRKRILYHLLVAIAHYWILVMAL